MISATNQPVDGSNVTTVGIPYDFVHKTMCVPNGDREYSLDIDTGMNPHRALYTTGGI
jgi:hypothetical protein